MNYYQYLVSVFKTEKSHEIVFNIQSMHERPGENGPLFTGKSSSHRRVQSHKTRPCIMSKLRGDSWQGTVCVILYEGFCAIIISNIKLCSVH